MNRVVEILMRRDDMGEEEANALVDDVRDMITDDSNCAEDIMMEELGLEMDYILDILYKEG